MEKKQEIRIGQYTTGNILTVLLRMVQCMNTMVNQTDKVWMKIGVMAGWSYEKVGEMKTLAGEIANNRIEDIYKIQNRINDLNLLMAFVKEHSSGNRWSTIDINNNLDKAQYQAFRWFSSADLPQLGWSGNWNGGHPAWLKHSKYLATVETFADDDDY